MNRTFLAIAATLMGLAAGMAHAGAMNFTNGQGVWRSTQCARPVPPSQQTNSETPANAMNRTTTDFNQYIDATNRYMACVTQEAKVDAEASSRMVLNSLQQDIANMQVEVLNQRSALGRR